MRVVHLHGERARQVFERALFGQMRGEDVLDARADEEVLLLEAQLLALRRGVVRIQHARQVLRLDLVLDRGRIVAGVEVLDVKRLQRARRPQPQVIDRGAAIARHQLIEADGEDVGGFDPARTLAAADVVGTQHASAEAHDVARIGARRFPHVVQPQPGAGGFALPAVGVDGLREDAVVVADAVTRGRVLQRRERIEETGRQPAEATVAQTRIHFERDDRIEVVAHAGDRGAGLVDQFGIEARQRVDQRTARQEFHRQVTKPLDPGARDAALRREPTRGQFLPDGERQSVVDVARRRGLRLFAQTSASGGRKSRRASCHAAGSRLLPASDHSALELPFTLSRDISGHFFMAPPTLHAS